MEVEKVMSMQGGDGEGSYLQNSKVQNRGFHIYGKPYLARAIELYKEYNGIKRNHRGSGIDRSSSSSSSSSSCLIRIVDYGCSYGWNTLDCMRFVLDTMLGPNPVCYNKDQLESSPSAAGEEEEEENNGVVRRSSASSIITDRSDRVDARLEFQYLFVDLPSNDFNTLFRMLHDPNFAKAFDDDDLRLFSAGIAGSFYECVVPMGSVDIAISTYSMHWLSQVPPELKDKADPAWNGGHVWIPSDGAKPIANAYSRQFRVDMRRFLQRRAEEMSHNGVMFLQWLGRESVRAPGPSCQFWGSIFNNVWDQLVSEGTVKASEKDAFNLHLYESSEAEFQEVLQDVAELELVELRIISGCDHLTLKQREHLFSDSSAFGKFCASFSRSITQPLLEAHIGPDRTSMFFERIETIMSKSLHNLIDLLIVDLLIAIIRKK